jgi:hypothetical protein
VTADSFYLLLIPIAGSLYYAALGFLEATGKGEKPDPVKLAATLVVGGSIAFVDLVAGQTLTQQDLLTALLANAGAVVTVQKGISALLGWVGRGSSSSPVAAAPAAINFSSPAPAPVAVSTVTVIADRPGLYVNIARTMPYPQQSVQEYHHVGLGTALTGSWPVAGGAVYQVTLVDADGLYGGSFGGSRSMEGKVPVGATVKFTIPSLPDAASGKVPPATVS